jgi:hypothetical protein
MPVGSVVVLANLLTVLAEIRSGSYNEEFEASHNP